MARLEVAAPLACVNVYTTLVTSEGSNVVSTEQVRLDSTRAETRVRLSAKRASPCDLTGATVQSTTGSRGVRVSWKHLYFAGEAMLRGRARHAGYPFHSPVAPLFPLPRAAACHVILVALYYKCTY
jgi:hypothetical protein